MQGITENDLLDLTPALKAEAIEVAKRYKMGPIFTPPVVSSLDGPLATLQVPSEVGGANWPGGSFDPSNHLYVHSHRSVYLNALVGEPGAIRHGIRVGSGASRRCRRARGVALVDERAHLAAVAAAPSRGCRSSNRPTTRSPRTT